MDISIIALLFIREQEGVLIPPPVKQPAVIFLVKEMTYKECWENIDGNNSAGMDSLFCRTVPIRGIP